MIELLQLHVLPQLKQTLPLVVAPAVAGWIPLYQPVACVLHRLLAMGQLASIVPAAPEKRNQPPALGIGPAWSHAEERTVLAAFLVPSVMTVALEHCAGRGLDVTVVVITVVEHTVVAAVAVAWKESNNVISDRKSVEASYLWSSSLEKRTQVEN